MPCHLIEHKDNFNFLPNINRKIKSGRIIWAGNVAGMREMRNTFKVSVGNPEERRPLGRPRRKWEDNIRIDVREIRLEGVDWMNLAQDRDL